jgi:hypothetical protein
MSRSLFNPKPTTQTVDTPTKSTVAKYTDLNPTTYTADNKDNDSKGRIANFTNNLKIITNDLIDKLESVKTAVKDDKDALDNLNNVIDTLHKLSEENKVSKPESQGGPGKGLEAPGVPPPRARTGGKSMVDKMIAFVSRKTQKKRHNRKH